ncbi:MAG: PilW family protein [Candidatus Competibacteraceae bacterium]
MSTLSFPLASRLGIRSGNLASLSVHGFSLIEVMVALTISLFLLLGVTYVYTGGKQTYRSTASLSRMQENGRLAFQYLSQDLMMAGSFGCATSSFKSDSDYQYFGQPTANTCPSGTPALSGKLVNTLTNPSNFGSNFRYTIIGYDGQTAVAGSPGTTPSFDRTLMTGAVSTTGTTRALDNSDLLIVTGAMPLGITITTHTASTGDITIPALPAGLKSLKATANTNTVVAADCQGAGVFFITNALTTGTTTLSHATGGSNKNQCSDLGKTFVSGEILKAFSRAYYIAVDSTTNLRTLYRREMDGTDQALVPGIENMQIKYGLATSLEGYPADYYTAAQITDGSHTCNDKATGGTSTGLNVWDCVKSVQVDLMVLSAEDNVTAAAQTLWFNGSDFTAPDKRLRLVMTTTIGVRNRLLQSQ